MDMGDTNGGKNILKRKRCFVNQGGMLALIRSQLA